MNALTKLAPLMIALCGLMIVGTVSALVVWLVDIPNQDSVTRAIYQGINLIYIAELAFIATMLWLLKDTVRALSFYFFMFTVFCSELITQTTGANVRLLQAVSGVIFLSMINIIIQSYFIQPKQLAQGYLTFGWALSVRHAIYIAFPYYAATRALNIEAYRYLSLINVIAYAALLFTLIRILQHLKAGRIKTLLNSDINTGFDSRNNF